MLPHTQGVEVAVIYALGVFTGLVIGWAWCMRDLRRQRKIDAAKAAQKTAQKAVKP